jgi:uncharacterized GH25 family protein
MAEMNLALAFVMALAAPPAEPVKGTVVWPDGRPAVGVRVTSTSMNFHRQDQSTVTTGADGTFEMDVPDVARYGVASLVAAEPGRAFGHLQWVKSSGKPAHIVLQAVRTASGRVVDREGAPIEGAEVRLVGAGGRGPQSRSGWWARMPDLPEFHTRTDADGRWRLETIPSSGEGFLQIEHPAYATPVGRFQNVIEGPPRELLHVMIPRARLSGIVLNDGRPVPRAEVTIMRGGRDDEQRVRADAQGRFEAAVAPGRFTFSARAEDGRLASRPTAGVLTPGAAGEVAIALERTFELRGKLDPNPLRADRIEATPAHRSGPTRAIDAPHHPLYGRMDPDGTFSIWLPPGEWQINTYAEHGVVQVDRSGVRGEVRLETQLEPGRKLHVRAVGGEPGRAYSAQDEQVIGTDGAEIDYLDGWVVVASADGRRFAAAIPTGAAALELPLLDGVRVTGRVVDSEGRPLPESDVWAEPNFDSRNYGWMMRDLGTAVRTDPQGRFEMLLPPSVSQTLRIHAAGYDPYASDEFALGPGAERPLGEIRLSRSEGVLEAVVLDEDGVPVVGATITAYQENTTSGIARATTDAQGRFQLTQLAAGTYSVTVSHLLYENANRRGIKPNQALEIRLKPLTPFLPPNLSVGAPAPSLEGLRMIAGAVPEGARALLFGIPHHPATEEALGRLIRDLGGRASVLLVLDDSLTEDELRLYARGFPKDVAVGFVPGALGSRWQTGPLNLYGVESFPHVVLITADGRFAAVGASPADVRSFASGGSR